MNTEDHTDNSKRRLLDQPTEVVLRWVRLKASRVAPKLARSYMRWWLPIRERKVRRARETAFETIKTQTIRAEREGYTSTLAVFNVALYFMLAERDIQAVKIDALTHPDSWKRNLSTRVILLTIHEWDMDKAAGERLREALEFIEAPASAKKEVNDALRAVRKVQSKARKKLGFVRNSTIAHRDPDALVQYRSIRNLRPEEVLGLAAEFYQAADRLIGVIPALVGHSSTLEALFRQRLRRPVA